MSTEHRSFALGPGGSQVPHTYRRTLDGPARTGAAVGLLGNRELRAALERGSERYGERFDTAGLAERFAPYYGTGQRIRVTTTYGKGRDAEVYTRTGTVGMTTGWRPSFLLIHRATDSGSSDVLSDRAVVTHVQVKGKYVPVAEVVRVQ